MLPSLFLSHGSPTVLIEKDSPGRAFLAQLGSQIERPKSILVVSAHWETESPTVTGAGVLETIHDFYGFPNELFQMTYPAGGAAALSQTVQTLLGAKLDDKRGLDHGAWSALKLMYPEADIPVVQLSLQSHLPAQYHYDIGSKLSELRKEGVLIIGSGAATHNLRALTWYDKTPDPWAVEYEDWLVKTVEEQDHDALLHARESAPHYSMAHPVDEHWLPIYVAMGAGDKMRLLHRGFEHRNLSMAAVAFD
ncbi:DODA-type extradiol aromatic ring-opening family dioxygenase [Terasakiella pusilla]|uniref:DODA-type extradiol aromatic ring-opening family dioxygenase n=1 Tax=Terasakiella pusilla TaxID=64973 RepID=UPI003AA7DFCC